MCGDQSQLGPCRGLTHAHSHLGGDKESSAGRRAEALRLLSFHMPAVNEDDEHSLCLRDTHTLRL